MLFLRRALADYECFGKYIYFGKTGFTRHVEFLQRGPHFAPAEVVCRWRVDVARGTACADGIA
jgi:hypothetical protein